VALVKLKIAHMKKINLKTRMVALIFLCIITSVGIVMGQYEDRVLMHIYMIRADKDVDEYLAQGWAEKTSIVEIFKQYQENQIRAEGLYKDKVLIVRGKVIAIGRSQRVAYVSLSEDKRPGSINCRFSDAREEQVKDLEKGLSTDMRRGCLIVYRSLWRN